MEPLKTLHLVSCFCFFFWVTFVKGKPYLNLKNLQKILLSSFQIN